MIGSRLFTWLAMFACAAWGFAASLSAAVISGPITSPTTGHHYYLLSENTWTASEQEAQSLGGHLATIESADEQEFLFNAFSTVGGVDRSLWIGLHDSQQEGTFVWASGAPVTYTNWLDAQPDNSPVYGGEDYVHMMRKNNGFGHPAGKWNDMDNLDSFPELQRTSGVVEVVPEPHIERILLISALAAMVTNKLLGTRGNRKKAL